MGDEVEKKVVEVGEVEIFLGEVEVGGDIFGGGGENGSVWNGRI